MGNSEILSVSLIVQDAEGEGETMKNKTLIKEKVLKEYFEEKYLKGTCFKTLDELLNDKTLVQVNAPRALIACELVGKWIGVKETSKQYENKIKDRIEKIKTREKQFPYEVLVDNKVVKELEALLQAKDDNIKEGLYEKEENTV